MIKLRILVAAVNCMASQTGKVYLVGSGPGNAAYLTLQARQILAEAEVLIYDALVDSDLLPLVPHTCLTLDVGKRGGAPSTPQTEINQLLVQYCRRGHRVVRLKSGDPFIFGRATSEIQALKQADCLVEVIPGLSSALVAPLLAGIPLTDPVLSRCFAVLTAHHPDALDWAALAQLETLVILMGGQHVNEITHRLMQHQRSLDTPIAIIQWAGRPQQQVWEGTLGSIGRLTAGETLSPCVMVIGEVVRLRPYLVNQTAATHSSPPPMSALANKTIVVTRAAGQAGQFSDRLHQLGATVIEMPALEIGPPSNWAGLDLAIAQLCDYDWVILTSANGVESFFERLLEKGLDARSLAGLQIAAVGEKTAQALEQRGIKPDFVPPEFVADSLAAEFPSPLEGLHLLFPRVESGGRDLLIKDLAEKGAAVVEVAAYQSRCPSAIAPAAWEALRQRRVDGVTFASSKTVKHFCQLLRQAQGDDSWRDWLDTVCIASIGPQTSKACVEYLGRVDVEASEYTLDGLTAAIVAWFSNPVGPGDWSP